MTSSTSGEQDRTTGIAGRLGVQLGRGEHEPEPGQAVGAAAVTHVVDPACGPRVAPRDPPGPHRRPAHDAVLLDGLERVP